VVVGPGARSCAVTTTGMTNERIAVAEVKEVATAGGRNQRRLAALQRLRDRAHGQDTRSEPGNGPPMRAAEAEIGDLRAATRRRWPPSGPNGARPSGEAQNCWPRWRSLSVTTTTPPGCSRCRCTRCTPPAWWSTPTPAGGGRPQRNPTVMGPLGRARTFPLDLAGWLRRSIFGWDPDDRWWEPTATGRIAQRLSSARPAVLLANANGRERRGMSSCRRNVPSGERSVVVVTESVPPRVGATPGEGAPRPGRR
jgi:hypothetical protein